MREYLNQKSSIQSSFTRYVSKNTHLLYGRKERYICAARHVHLTNDKHSDLIGSLYVAPHQPSCSSVGPT